MAVLRASQMGVYPGGAFQEEDEEDPDVKRMKAPGSWVSACLNRDSLVSKL